MVHYFDTPIQRQFLYYMDVFGDWRYFQQHTGIVCVTVFLRSLEKKFKYIEKMHKEAKRTMDLKSLEQIEKGTFHVATGPVRSDGHSQ